MKGPVRMRDVAAAAGVDPSVVSRVLRDDKRLSIRPETRQRVLDAIEQMGYRPNAAARTLKTARSMAIGMVVTDIANAAYTEIAHGADARAGQLGYVLLLANGTIEDRLPILHGRVDGLLYGIATSDSPLPSRPLQGMPCLLVNRRAPELGTSIAVDDQTGAALATRHLIELGHRRIAAIVGAATADTTRRRIAGFTDAMREAGLDVSPDQLVETTYDEEGGYAAAVQLLERDERPTAILATIARPAYGALAACNTRGIVVPDEISLVTFDDPPITRYLHPPLTAVKRPLREMGSRAVELLLELVDGKPVDDLVLENCELIIRSSTAPPPA
jgi:LacI family transcriptional regulator